MKYMRANSFNNLPIHHLILQLNHKSQLQLILNLYNHSIGSCNPSIVELKAEWKKIQKITNNTPIDQTKDYESLEVDWLITVFNSLFASKNVILVRGNHEPEYLPASTHKPARIEFANGFFQSALHEISHWCIAGEHRRTLPDFGYWYAPDGRTVEQQHAFEQFEIKPQAIECLFTLILGKKFDVSLDNLQSNFDTSKSNFKQHVYDQALRFINKTDKLPTDAKILLTTFTYLCHDNITEY